MPIRLCPLVVLVATAALVVACENQRAQPVGPSSLSHPVSPSTPENGQSAVVAVPAQVASSRGASQHVVTLFDACDPETFNAALGAGSCARSGGVEFAKFLEQLGHHGAIGAWHFAPSTVTMQVGQLLVAKNRGGEAHTFTEVEEFGGGIVPELNDLTGLTNVAPECNQLMGSDFLAPGASSSEEEEEAGVENYQCCIHPWMRAQVRVTEK